MGKYYGIDLGTTNSLIGNYEDNYLSDIVPSCVDMATGEAGTNQYTNPKAERGFKVNMSMGTEGAAPRKASMHVLKELSNVTNNKAKQVVISVPAYFSDNQRTATINSAKAAGFEVMGLVNEPTAAAIYIAQNKKSLFLVMDLGGGTFDVSIIDSRFGQYQVLATDGLIKGGNNLDLNIMKYLVAKTGIKLFRLTSEQEKLFRIFCATYKIQMTTNYGTDQHIDLSTFGGPSDYLFKYTDYIQLMKQTFRDTIDITKRLIETYIPEQESFEILLVGGSTKCPYYRDWITEELHQAPEELTYDPDRVVAQGAAYYAYLLEKGQIEATVSDVTKTLSIGLSNGTCSVLVPENSTVPLKVVEVYRNSTDTTKLELDLYQGNNMFAADNELIGQLIWDYGRRVKASEGLVYITIEVSVNGIIQLSCHESLGEEKKIIIDRRAL